MDISTEILKSKFKLNDFRLGQKNIIQSVVEAKDTLAVLPTGGGKSLCYQLPAYLKNQLVIVVSPLIALMKDQVESLRQKNLNAACLYAGQSIEEKKAVFQAINKHKAFILFLSPERVQKDGFKQWIKQKEIALFAIDEAHCVSQWGHDFRPEYSELKILKALRPDVPVLALTASATPLVLNDITKTLKLNKPQKHVHGFYRKNLFFQVQKCDTELEKWDLLKSALKKFNEGRVIIYCGTRKTAEEVANQLQKEFNQVGFYHAGLSNENRSKIQEQYDQENIRILVATNAFGMGIDHPNVRLVVHFNMPSSIDSLYQEMGRAGRDSQDSTCLTLFTSKDKGLQSYFIINSEANQDIKNHKWNALNSLMDYIDSSECRHAEILAYYQDSQKISFCGHCDNCAPRSDRKVLKTEKAAILRKSTKNKNISIISDLSNEQQILFEKLKDWRRKKANDLKTAAFVILNDKSLLEICSLLPQDLASLKNIYGFGDSKIEKYGTEILEILKK